MRLTDFKVLTFDCYGTLIDWESGLTDAYRGLVTRSGKSLTRDQILETHARYEAHQEAKTPTMPYSELLGVVHSMVAFTAQDIGSYKPNQRNFDYMIAKLAAEGIRKEEILHTAESLFHDHLPANKAGLASAD